MLIVGMVACGVSVHVLHIAHDSRRDKASRLSFVSDANQAIITTKTGDRYLKQQHVTRQALHGHNQVGRNVQTSTSFTVLYLLLAYIHVNPFNRVSE